MWLDVKWHFADWWFLYLIAAIIVVVTFVLWFGPAEWFEYPPQSITITEVARGKIISVRATGAWENWCKIELKFEDGTIILTSYPFIRKYNIREGVSYTIQDNSYYGRVAVKL